jgi:hypothetical protein
MGFCTDGPLRVVNSVAARPFACQRMGHFTVLARTALDRLLVEAIPERLAESEVFRPLRRGQCQPGQSLLEWSCRVPELPRVSSRPARPINPSDNFDRWADNPSPCLSSVFRTARASSTFSIMCSIRASSSMRGCASRLSASTCSRLKRESSWLPLRAT